MVDPHVQAAWPGLRTLELGAEDPGDVSGQVLRLGSPHPGGAEPGAELRRFPLPLRHPWGLSRGTVQRKEYWFLRLWGGGWEGFGEAAHNARYGETPESVRTRLEAGVARLCAAPPEDWPALAAEASGERSAGAAEACLEMAVLDRRGRASGQSLFRMLGLPERRVPPTCYSIGIDDLEIMRRKLEEAPGFVVYKIKLGTERDEEIVTALREATPALLRVDANEGWKSREEALHRIDWLADRGVELVEQPLPAGRLADMRWLCERSPLPLVADEDVRRAADLDRLEGAFDGVNVKIMKAGGITAAQALMEEASRRGFRVLLGCMIESSLGISAAAPLQVLADWVDLDGHLLLAQDPFRGADLVEGRIAISEEPGLGAQWRRGLA